MTMATKRAKQIPKRIPKRIWDQLAAEALAARKQAYAPYSKFKVGAALLLSDPFSDAADSPTIIRGCNMENASYGAAICAERTAIAQAIASGHRHFYAIAVATAGPEPAAPCGLCLQVLVEFCEELDILLCNLSGKRRKTKLSKLLTKPFRSRQLR